MEIQNEIKNNADDMRDVIVSVEHLKTYFNAGKTWGRKQVVKAVDDVSFQIHKGETYGLVGESGCGKSTLGRTIVKINEPTDGKILVNGEDITHLSGQKLKKFRKNIQLIFQDPYASLNPRMTVGEIIREPMVIHHIYQTRKEQDDRVAELLKIVGLKPDHVRRYPHEFSELLKYVRNHYREVITSGKITLLVLYNYARALDLCGRYEDGMKLAKEGRDACIQYGHYQTLPGCLEIYAECCHFLGMDDESTEAYYQAYYLCKLIGRKEDLEITRNEAKKYLNIDFKH